MRESEIERENKNMKKKEDVSVREGQRQIQRLQIKITLLFYDMLFYFTSDFDP